MNDQLKIKIKRFIPNVPFVRSYLNQNKLKRLRGRFLPPEDVLRGEQDPAQKAELVRAFAEKKPTYTASINEQIETYFDHEPQLRARPDVDSLRTDILFNAFAYGFAPDEYFFYYIEGKTPEEKREYISDQERYLLTYAMNDVVDIQIFYDKFRTYEKLKPYFQREAVGIEHPEDYPVFRQFIERHPVFVRKSVAASRGHGVSRVDSTGQDPEALFNSLIAMGKQMLEELVVQSDEMMRFNPSSVNTVRCPTFRTVRGIELAPCRFRVGQNGAFVDNAGSGGILAGVDVKTGVVNTNGRDEYCREYVTHPQSGLTFMGFQIPEWDLLVQTVTEMAETMPNMGYISWDMAHTDHGWVIIEANGAGQFIGSQIVAQRGLKKQIAAQLEGVYSF